MSNAVYVTDANPAQAYRMPRLISLLFALPSRLANARLTIPRLPAALGLVAIICIGCGDPPQIRKYTVSGKIPEQLQTRDRMLAAIIPRKSDVWFVKVVGSVDAIKLVESPIRDFVSNLTFKRDVPDLTNLPEAWNRGGPKPMREATILIDMPDAQLDVSISKLPLSGDWDEQVAINVNRWRGQMKLTPSEEKWAGAESIKVASAQDHEAIWVDLMGEMGGGPSMSPMTSKKPPFADVAAQAADATPDRTAPQNPPDTNVTPEPDDDSGLKYDKPETWRPGKMSMMRMAAFNIGPENATAELTIIQAGGDLRGNVARWLGQVRGDTPPDDIVDKALAEAVSMKVSGREAQRFIMTSDDGSGEGAAQGIDATIVSMDGGMSMFIKATGPPKTLQEEKDRIGEFIDSIEFPQ